MHGQAVVKEEDGEGTELVLKSAMNLIAKRTKHAVLKPNR
jgi:hypothetical protein